LDIKYKFLYYSAESSSVDSATALTAYAKSRTGACNTETSIESKPSRPGIAASSLISSLEVNLPSSIPPLISITSKSSSYLETIRSEERRVGKEWKSRWGGVRW